MSPVATLALWAFVVWVTYPVVRAVVAALAERQVHRRYTARYGRYFADQRTPEAVGYLGSMLAAAIYGCATVALLCNLLM